MEAKTVAEFREALRKNLIKPMEMVMISRERIEEVLDEAVDQGRVTARDAQRITSGLVKRGQGQTRDVLKDLENLLERGAARSAAHAGARKAADGRGRERARRPRARAARRPHGLAGAGAGRQGAARGGRGPNFPILEYDELNATQIQARLKDLTPAELRKVRDYERRNSNRKTILKAIETKLG